MCPLINDCFGANEPQTIDPESQALKSAILEQQYEWPIVDDYEDTSDAEDSGAEDYAGGYEDEDTDMDGDAQEDEYNEEYEARHVVDYNKVDRDNYYNPEDDECSPYDEKDAPQGGENDSAEVEEDVAEGASYDLMEID